LELVDPLDAGEPVDAVDEAVDGDELVVDLVALLPPPPQPAATRATISTGQKSIRTRIAALRSVPLERRA
jgi:hypothetical protein